MHEENLMAMAKLSLNTQFVEVKDDSFLSPETLKKRREAALEVLSLLNRKFYALDGSPHAPTILFAAAWLAGTSLYRSLQQKKYSLPGRVIALQDLNTEWDTLVYLLEEYTLQRADVPVGRIVLAAMAAPQSFKPQIGMSDVQGELWEQYSAVMEARGFNTLESAGVGVLLCSILIQQYSQAGWIDVEAATGIAAQGIFEAARQCLLP